jgi:hypothetical protein
MFRSILVSLKTFHLPAEVALQSIRPEKKREIANGYNGLINMIDDHLAAEYNQAAITDVPYEATYLCYTIIRWTYHNHDEAERKPVLKKYLFQKLFVVLLHVSHLAPKSRCSETLVTLTAKSIAEFDIERLCVCEGIMLSVFLRRPFINRHNKWVGLKIPKQEELQTLWDGVLGENGAIHPITRYTINLVNTVLPDMGSYNPPESQATHVYRTFIDEIIEFVRCANSHNMGCHNCGQLLLWATYVWDLVLESDDSLEKHEIKDTFQKTMHKMIAAFGHREAGPKTLN